MFGGDAPRLDEVEALAGLGVWTWNVSRNELAWSAGLRALLNVGEDAASFELWLSRVHPDDLSTVKSYFTRMRREPGLHAIEYRVVEATGAIRTIHTRSRATAERVCGVDQDITQTKETAARVVFSDRMVAIGTLAGGVAHEINNPLAIISANLQLVADGAELSLIGEAQRAVDRIKTIVRGLTAFSRSNDDPRLSIDLARVLDLALSLTGGAIRHRARLIADVSPVPWVRADEARLGQVFINLLVNAMEAIPETDARQHEIRVSARTDAAGWAIVEVSDTGGGIPSDVQARIFDPFFTTKPVGQGTGLGLSICHGIVRSLGGDITFRTVSGQGTTFSIALPPAETPASAPGGAPVVASGVRRGAVLIVDDEVLFASSLRRLLAAEHDVTVTSSGRDALAQIQGGARFDAILCDLMMPGMTGAELHAAIAEVEPALTARMVFITGGAFSPASQAFLDRVSNRCFEKPCDIGLLRAAVRALVNSG
jgi:signal transduction histidine kinase/CheY-like chemotaxis protein